MYNSDMSTARKLFLQLFLPTLAACFLLQPLHAAEDRQPKDRSETLEISWLNGEHSDLDSNFAPIRRGPLLLDVSSPSHVLTIHSNRLDLRPVAGEEAGTLDIEMEVDFEATGDLVITLHTDAGKGTTFEDRVSAPRQTVRVRGRAHFQPSPNGYVVTVRDGSEPVQEKVEMSIESRLAGQIVNSCAALAAFLRFDCDGLGESLSVAVVPMPKAGTKFFVASERFTKEEQAVLDALIR